MSSHFSSTLPSSEQEIAGHDIFISSPVPVFISNPPAVLNTDNIPPAIREIKLKSPKNGVKPVDISINGPNPATAKALLPFLDHRTFSEGDLRIIARSGPQKSGIFGCNLRRWKVYYA